MNDELQEALNSYFVKSNQLSMWLDVSEHISEEYGLQKALGYLVGEKLYEMINSLRRTTRYIEKLDKKKREPGYDPIVREGNYVSNLDEQYEDEQKTVFRLKLIIPEFARLIRYDYDTSEILEYFSSNPRMGALGHTMNEEEHEFFAESGAVKHSLETEIEDSLIIGEMKKLLIEASGYE